MAQIEARIGKAARLDEIGLGDSQFLEDSLQPAIVEQGDLHGILDRQRLTQKHGYLSVGLGSFFRSSRPLDVFGKMPACGIRDGIEAAVPGEARAAADAEHDQRHQQKKCVSHIVLLASQGGNQRRNDAANQLETGRGGRSRRSRATLRGGGRGGREASEIAGRGAVQSNGIRAMAAAQHVPQ